MNNKMQLELEEYHDILLNQPSGDIGRQYLKQRRITKATAIHWKMGYCPVGYVPDVYKTEVYPFWQKLWGRVVFGVYDSNGQLVSISGRKVLDVATREKNPKYDHYPFDARKTLFGLWQNQEDIFNDNKGVITEGQLDVISAWQNGIKIITSSFGAHCSEYHFTLLSRYTDNIYVMYDNDAAGEKGTKMAKDICKNNGIKAKFKSPFKQGMDLDQWVQTHTKDEFYKILEYDKMSYLINRLNNIEKSR